MRCADYEGGYSHAGESGAELAARIIGGDVSLTIALDYEGRLPTPQPGDQCTEWKQKIRQAFSEQLDGYWTTDAKLIATLNAAGGFGEGVIAGNMVTLERWRPFWKVLIHGYQTSAIVTRQNGLLCHLHVDLRRREEPGQIILRSGPAADLDNRLKVLFDALRVPHQPKDVPAHMHGTGSVDLFCLLEDDSLISELSIKTHKWTRPLKANDSPDTVRISLIAEIVRHVPHEWTDCLS